MGLMFFNYQPFPTCIHSYDEPPYRAIDSTGATINFVLSGLHDAATAKRLFRKALTDPSHPAAPCHQHGPGPPLRLGDCRGEKGRTSCDAVAATGQSNT